MGRLKKGSLAGWNKADVFKGRPLSPDPDDLNEPHNCKVPG